MIITFVNPEPSSFSNISKTSPVLTVIWSSLSSDGVKSCVTWAHSIK